MTRAEYIEAVKVKLEEISPFDEPESFIAADGDPDYANVKPIVSYIDATLDEATSDCLKALPLSLLHADIEHVKSTGSAADIAMDIDDKGVGRFSIAQGYRLIRFRHEALKRDITAFITTEDALYLLQQNPFTRGGIAKPVAVWSSADSEMEIYSFPKELEDTTGNEAVLLGIDTNKKPGSDETKHISSPIEEYIVLECAAMVSEILKDANTTTILRQEIQNKIQSELR